MSTLKEDLTAIKEIQDGLVNNKVARFSYTQNAYDANTVDGVNEYNVNNEQNIPNGTASIMKVNSTVLDKGYRAQASSITRMLMNHFLGRISYNLNKVNDNMKSLIDSLNSHLGTANGIATLDSDGKLSQIQFPDISPDLSRVEKIILVNNAGQLITWITEFDCWILEVIVYENTEAHLKIKDKANYAPAHIFKTIHVGDSSTFVVDFTVRCPYFVKKGIPITFTQSNITGSGIIVAPCMYVNA